MFQQFHFPTGIEFEVEGKVVPVNCIWAHTKAAPRGRTAPFRFTVPKPRLKDIFSPEASKPLDQPWLEFVNNELQKMKSMGADSMLIQQWLSRAQRCEHLSRKGAQWVICSITNVVDRDDALTVEGIVEEFAPHLY
jgi:hypothetical protein